MEKKLLRTEVVEQEMVAGFLLPENRGRASVAGAHGRRGWSFGRRPWKSQGHHGRLGTLLFACRERALGGVVVSVHGAGKGTGMGRSDGGLACLLEEEEEGGEKGEQQQGEHRLGGFLRHVQGRRELCVWGRGGRSLWRLGG
jgi:hypothetical protein